MATEKRELNVSTELLDHRTMLVMTVDRPLVRRPAMVKYQSQAGWTVINMSDSRPADTAGQPTEQLMRNVMAQLRRHIRAVMLTPATDADGQLTRCQMTFHLADGADVYQVDACVFQALAEAYDLILLDIMLPGLSGLEVLRRLRREKRYMDERRLRWQERLASEPSMA